MGTSRIDACIVFNEYRAIFINVKKKIIYDVLPILSLGVT